MTQLLAVAIAAFFLGIGMAGEPLNAPRAIVAGVILTVAAFVLGGRASPLATFLVAFLGVLLACYLQHGEIYPGTGVVALGLGGLAASSYGRAMAPTVIAVLGTLVGVSLFLLL
jgi:hypothetical protein